MTPRTSLEAKRPLPYGSGLCCSFCEIQAGEITMIFSGGLVISVGGGGFVCEVAEVVFFVVAMYLGGPFFLSFVPVDAFVF